MPTYMEWDRTVLEHCWDSIDFISAHRYSRNDRDDTTSFLAEGVEIDASARRLPRRCSPTSKASKRSQPPRLRFLRRMERLVPSDRRATVAGRKHRHYWKRSTTSRTRWCARSISTRSFATPTSCELACLAQIVNVIAPILTRPDGLLVQTIFWPFKLLRDAVSGDALRAAVRAPEIATRRGDVPVIDVAATYDDANATACVSIGEPRPHRGGRGHHRHRRCIIRGRDAQVITGDPKAHNDWGAPNVIRPVETDIPIDDRGALHVALSAPSHTVISLRRRG